MGGRLSDHGLNHPYADFGSEADAAAIFERARAGSAATPEEHSRFASYMMLVFGRLDAEKGWTKQMHLGARRNNNTRRYREMGPDTGWDSIGDFPQGEALGAYLDRLEQENCAAQDGDLQPEPRGQLRDRHHDRQLPGRRHGRQDSVRQRLVVPGPEGSDAVADERAVQLRADLARFWACSRIPGRSCRTRGTSISAGCCATCSARTSRTAKLPDSDELVAPLIRNICYGNARRFLGLGCRIAAGLLRRVGAAGRTAGRSVRGCGVPLDEGTVRVAPEILHSTGHAVKDAQPDQGYERRQKAIFSQILP